jgi:hypothetical protein
MLLMQILTLNFFNELGRGNPKDTTGFLKMHKSLLAFNSSKS